MPAGPHSTRSDASPELQSALEVSNLPAAVLSLPVPVVVERRFFSVCSCNVDARLSVHPGGVATPTMLKIAWYELVGVATVVEQLEEENPAKPSSRGVGEGE